MAFFIFAQSTGLEPATSHVTGGCSNQLSYDCKYLTQTYISESVSDGVGDRERSCDLGLMSPALYQLSYADILPDNYSDYILFGTGHSIWHVTCRLVAGPGIEPGSQGYEPCEIPLLYPAIYYLLYFRETIQKSPLRAYLLLYLKFRILQ